jgi:hypothetical protein
MRLLRPEYKWAIFFPGDHSSKSRLKSHIMLDAIYHAKNGKKTCKIIEKFR